ncbi:ribonuclease domain-containing protein [Lysobacter koreensis]|uniref:Ribonuclease domain-containing protein n=1 Tax=Lysobacter koreensis TaxID=266122 RepID=A0ABW2YT75_9GAMM
MRRHHWLLAAIVLLGLWFWTQRPDQGGELATPATPPGSPPVVLSDARPPQPAEAGRSPASAYPEFLPREAHAVLAAIARGGPYAYRQDGGVFQNRERLLPAQPRGYYREFTVATPGSDDRGARRLITGGEPPVEYFYTEDHYRSFRRFELRGEARR